MELKIGEYIIPEGCTIKRIGNTIQVYQKKKQIDTSALRCRDVSTAMKTRINGIIGIFVWQGNGEKTISGTTLSSHISRLVRNLKEKRNSYDTRRI